MLLLPKTPICQVHKWSTSSSLDSNSKEICKGALHQKNHKVVCSLPPALVREAIFLVASVFVFALQAVQGPGVQGQ